MPVIPPVNPEDEKSGVSVRLAIGTIRDVETVAALEGRDFSDTMRLLLDATVAAYKAEKHLAEPRFQAKWTAAREKIIADEKATSRRRR